MWQRKKDRCDGVREAHVFAKRVVDGRTDAFHVKTAGALTLVADNNSTGVTEETARHNNLDA
jgi:hypothetical protein